MSGFGVPELIILVLLLTPFVLWVIALVDIIRFDFTDNNKVLWLLIVLLVPLLGSILYFVIGRKQKIDRNQLNTRTAGGKKFCSACGEELRALAELCPKCGVRQPSQQKQTSIAVVILILVVVLFGGVAITGILAAIAIPQFAAYRTQGYNAAAKSDLKNVKIAIESYFAANQKYPDSLSDIRVAVGKDVDVEMQKVDSNKYVVVAAHKNGNKVFMMNSDDSKMYYKDKSTPDAEFVPVQ